MILGVLFCVAGILPARRRHPGVEGVPPTNRGLEARDTIDAFDTWPLLCQGLDSLWAHCSVVDADVVDQAGEVGSGFHSLACTDV